MARYNPEVHSDRIHVPRTLVTGELTFFQFTTIHTLVSKTLNVNLELKIYFTIRCQSVECFSIDIEADTKTALH